MSDNIIKKNIDDIESGDELKLRMLTNIKRKAAEREQSTQNKTVGIVKWAVPAAACFAAAITAAAVIPKLTAPEELPKDPPVMAGSPFASVSSAKELEERSGIAIDAPKGAEKVEYSIINDSIAEVYFLYGKNSYTLRASEQTDDFSGLYGSETASERLDDANGAILTTVEGADETYLKLVWTKEKTVFILMNTDGGGTEEIKEIYSLLK